MAVPKSKVSRSKRGSRRAHDSLSKLVTSYDATTGEAKLQHNISLDGYYKGKLVMPKKVKRSQAEEGNE